MSTPDLTEVQTRVNESRQQYLHAEEIYEKDGPDDGREATEQFLVKFLGPEPKRSPFAKPFAEEAIHLIQDFGTVRARMATDISILNGWIGNVISQLRVDVSADFITNTFPAMDSSSADPTKRLLEWKAQEDKNHKEMEKRNALRLERAAEAGNRLDTIQRLASSLLLMRQATLRKFRRENLQITLPELRRRVEEQLKEASKDELLEKAVSTMYELLEKFIKIVAQETIFVKVVLLFVKLWQSIRRKVDTKPGGLDLMESLLQVLRDQNAVFVELEQRYAESMKWFQELTPLV